MKGILTVTMMAAIFIVGCSEQSNAPKKNQAGGQKPKTVVVNVGMSKEEEDKLNQRLADLEEKVNDQSPPGAAHSADRER
jgi:PBP1b-binding outer membrane lipoprotein LpoB